MAKILVFMLLLVLFIREAHFTTLHASQANLQLQLKPLYEALLKSSDLQALDINIKGDTPYRLNIFSKNVQQINSHNSGQKSTFQMEINKFALLTQAEFQQHYFGLLINNKPISLTESHDLEEIPDEIHESDDQNHEVALRSIRPKLTISPQKINVNFNRFFILPINWKSRGKVTPVKNQGGCGSCWAFSAIGALESAFLIQFSLTTSLSQQQLVDCSGAYGNYGCSGGWQYRAFNYIRAKRITTSAVYPYTAKNGNCVYKNEGIYVSSYRNATNTAANCAPLRSALYARPQSVALDASGWAFYKSGVYNNCPASPSLNHAVLLIGLDWSSNWIIKNSWGTGWGDNGYITVRKDNCIGICNMPGSAPYV